MSVNEITVSEISSSQTVECYGMTKDKDEIKSPNDQIEHIYPNLNTHI